MAENKKQEQQLLPDGTVQNTSCDDEQRIMRKLQDEYYMSVKESPDLLRPPSMEDIARLTRMKVIRKKSFDRQKSDRRLQCTRQEHDKPLVRTSNANPSRGGPSPLPREVELTKDESLSQTRSMADRSTNEKNGVKASSLRVVHEELMSRRLRESHRVSHLRPSLSPELQAISEEIKKYHKVVKTTGTHLQVTSNLRTIHAELASHTEQKAALKYGPPDTTREFRTSRRSQNRGNAPFPRRTRSTLIPKTSPLARFKREWSSDGASDDSCCSSIDDFDSVDVECLDSPTTTTSDPPLDQSIEFKSIGQIELKSRDNDDTCSTIEMEAIPRNSMNLSELALNLSCLLSTVNLKETFDTRSSFQNDLRSFNSAKSA